MIEFLCTGDAQEWRDVTINDGKYVGKYQVSNDGQVRAHPAVRKQGMRPGRILFQSRDDSGYPQVMLYCDCVAHTVKVHRLVAEAFLGLRLVGMTINHIDGIKTNNSLENLEYVSNKENCRHAHRVVPGRSSVVVDEQRMSWSEAVDRYGAEGVTSGSARRRFLRLGWSVHKALTTPIQPSGRPRYGQIPA